MTFGIVFYFKKDAIILAMDKRFFSYGRISNNEEKLIKISDKVYLALGGEKIFCKHVINIFKLFKGKNDVFGILNTVSPYIKEFCNIHQSFINKVSPPGEVHRPELFQIIIAGHDKSDELKIGLLTSLQPYSFVPTEIKEGVLAIGGTYENQVFATEEMKQFLNKKDINLTDVKKKTMQVIKEISRVNEKVSSNGDIVIIRKDSVEQESFS